MISALNFTSVLGDSLDFSVGETPPITWLPVNYFNCSDIPMRGEKRPKMQSPGRWPNYQVPEEMPIEARGELLADVDADMITRRKAFFKALRPFGPITEVPLDTIVGTVTITLEGTGEVLYTDVGLETASAPIDATSSAPYRVCQFQIVWSSPVPWWTSASLDAVFL